MGFGTGCSDLPLLKKAGDLEWFTKKCYETAKQTTTSGPFDVSQTKESQDLSLAHLAFLHSLYPAVNNVNTYQSAQCNDS
jgi:hypothetical protein